jgi:hypothetical protein
VVGVMSVVGWRCYAPGEAQWVVQAKGGSMLLGSSSP